MKKPVLLILAMLCPLLGSAAQVDTPYGKAEYTDTLASGLVTEISFYSPDIVNVRHYQQGCTVKHENLVVTMTDADVSVTVEQSGNICSISSADLTVNYDTTTGAVSFEKDAQTLFQEKSGGTTLSATTDGSSASYTVTQRFLLDANETVYGLGQIQNGKFNQRGSDLQNMIEGNRTVWIPYLHSTKGYALFWDNASPTSYKDDTSSNEIYFSSEAGYGVDYYFLLGSATDGNVTVKRMRELSGDVPLMPLWAYGFLQSKDRYKSTDEVMSVGSEYRRLQVPIDGVIQDWQYWGNNNTWNGMEFLASGYSNPTVMTDSVHNMHQHMFISTWANFGPDTKPYSYFKENGELIKQGENIMTSTYPDNEGVAIYDPYSADARDHYWQYLYDGLISKGIDAYWLDSSEPDHFQDGDAREETFNFQTGLGCTWRSVRNAFPLMHVGGVYTHHRAQKELEGKRCAILTRSAYAGQQRYGSNTWSGDVTGDWASFKNQLPAALNFIATGNPNWNSDLGGYFTGNLGTPGSESYNELYARWLQMGTFCPMMRAHGCGVDKAIYVWGRRGEKWFDIVERYINLRYRMMPYTYSTAWGVHANGESFMTPLGIEFPQDENVLNVADEYMYGQNILVAPVTEQGAESRQVYLPNACGWVDFWTGNQVNGGQQTTADAPIEKVPLFVRQGSIVPWAKKSQYANVADWDTLQIRVYPGADGDFTLFEDSGDSYGYENGQRSLIKFHWNDAARQLTVAARDGSFDGMKANRVFDVVLVNDENGIGDSLSAKANKRIEYSGSEVTVQLSDDTFDVEYADAPAQVDNTDYHFDLSDFNPSISGTGTYTNQVFTPEAKGFGGWWRQAGLNLTGYHYIVAKLADPVPTTVALRAYDQNDYSALPVSSLGNGQSNVIYLDLSDLSSVFGVGFWSLNSQELKIEDVYLTDTLPSEAAASAATAYTFTATDWTTGDAGRVSQDNISYADNQLTVTASGQNNVALQLSVDKSDQYYITSDQQYMYVKGTNLSTEASDNAMWFGLGKWLGTINPDTVFTSKDDETVVGWNLKQWMGYHEQIPLSYSGSFIFCLGLTSTTGTSVISDINFCTAEELKEMGKEVVNDEPVAYQFVPTDWVTGDANRVAQDNISYTENEGKITVHSTGDNNVALQLDLSKSGHYFITSEQSYLMIHGTNLETGEGKNALWFALGQWVGTVSPKVVRTFEDGSVLVAWNLQSWMGSASQVTLSTTGTFIFCLGMTSTTGTSVVNSITFGSREDVNNFSTGISSVASETESNSSEVYNLKGMSMNRANLPKGIYISNGKKFVVK
jgi:alpha-D-xyloside xylohydrolase